jgi:hypothetical protein
VHGVLAIRFATGVVVACACVTASAMAEEPRTISYTNRVIVGDFGSNGPLGCGKAVALSGGFANGYDRETSKLFLFGFNPTGRVVADSPFAGSPIPGGPTWRVTVANLGEGSKGAGRQRTLVYCARRRAGLRLVEARVPIAPGSTATATATCPAGTEAVSGGFSDQWAGTNGSLVFGFRSRRVGRRSWRASAINTSDSIASTLIAMANCDRRKPGLWARKRTIRVPATGTNATEIDCGWGQEAWSAGFESPIRDWHRGGAFPYLFKRIQHRAWRAAAFSSGAAGRFTLHVYCGEPR